MCLVPQVHEGLTSRRREILLRLPDPVTNAHRRFQWPVRLPLPRPAVDYCRLSTWHESLGGLACVPLLPRQQFR